MTLFSFAFIIVGSICFTLGCLHLFIYCRRQDLKTDLAFSCMAFAISFSTFLEIWTFKADTLTSYIPLFKATLLVQGILWICFAWFVFFFTRSKKLWPPQKEGKILYRIGLVMFCLPLLFGWLEPYISSILPGYESYQLVYNISGDVLFISSFFVLGGDFWDRLQALFVHRDSIAGPNEDLQHVSAKQYL